MEIRIVFGHFIEIIIMLRLVEETYSLQLQESLTLPSWYGRNLDALYDVLTEPGFGGGRCTICFTGCSGSGDGMQRYLEAMKQMCRAPVEENTGLAVEFVD